MDERTDGLMDGSMNDGQIDGWEDGLVVEWMFVTVG
jgi:hypothetical protein